MLSELWAPLRGWAERLKMPDNNNTEDKKHSIINPVNAVNGWKRLLGQTVDDDDSGEANDQGELLWMALSGYVIGNSLGSANTRRELTTGAKRVRLGPIYFW